MCVRERDRHSWTAGKWERGKRDGTWRRVLCALPHQRLKRLARGLATRSDEGARLGKREDREEGRAGEGGGRQRREGVIEKLVGGREEVVIVEEGEEESSSGRGESGREYGRGRTAVREYVRLMSNPEYEIIQNLI